MLISIIYQIKDCLMALGIYINEPIELDNSCRQGMAYQFYISKFLQIIISRSSLHGAFHITTTRNTVLEKYLWGFIMLMAILYSIFLMASFWIRYLTNPTLISLDRNYHEWNTTFPSLTVCFHDRLNTTARDIVIHRLKPENATKFEMFLDLLAETDITNIKQLQEYDEYSHMDINSIVNEIVNHVNNPVTLSNEEESTMHRVITELGICYSFNSAITKYLSVGANGNNLISEKLIEISIMERDTTASLNNLSSNANIYYHGPFEVPTFLKQLIVPYTASTFLQMSFKPVIITADTTIENLYVQQRNCRYPHESNLELFPIFYSHSLCTFECKLKLFLVKCGCVPYLYNLRINIPVCPMRKLACISGNLVKIQQTVASCGCLKDCNFINFMLQSYLLIEWFNNPLIKWDMVVSKVRYSRRIIFDIADLMVSTGGIAALCFGASFITIVEIAFLIVKNTFFPGYNEI
ncbi:pickpocket protein 28-like isoform X2 [Armigeres subalbatus]|uniref:pickpocket protein 28-like isoform X2 n=1 Tax=Armigeres subalbatus TaxID=124917 RepID=UPI002ED18ABB